MANPGQPKPRLARWLLPGAAFAVLMAVFVAYLQPEMALTLATRVWACF